MIKATIKVNGLNYGGEDTNKTADVAIGGQGGWYDRRHLGGADALIIGCPVAKDIQGMRNLKSEIDKIVQRIQLGQLAASHIEIEISNDK